MALPPNATLHNQLHFRNNRSNLDIGLMKKRRALASDEDLIKKIGDVEKILSAYDISKNAFATLFPTPFSLDSPRDFPPNSLIVELTSTEHDESDDIEEAKQITEEKKKEEEKQEKEGKKKENPIKRGLDKLKELI